MVEMTYAELGQRRRELQERLAEVTELLRLRAPEERAKRGPGHDSEMAREAGVDRMTMLKWLGKR
jgi:hypothetical protein